MPGTTGTAFTKENLLKDGAYITYAPNGRRWDEANLFVARFKRTRGAGSFMTHLRKNWTVEDYFAAYDGGKAPLTIVKETGYLLPHVKKMLKERGYPVTPEGFTALIDADIARHEARA
jgi:hypothetical protein